LPATVGAWPRCCAPFDRPGINPNFLTMPARTAPSNTERSEGPHTMCWRMEATMPQQDNVSRLTHYQRPLKDGHAADHNRTSAREEQVAGPWPQDEIDSAAAGWQLLSAAIADSINTQISSATSDLIGLATVAETARELRMSQRWLRRGIAAGEVHVVRFGRAVRIPRNEVQRLAKAGLAS
jgi:excisionase family DNA binding protein